MSIEITVEGNACTTRVEGDMTIYTVEAHRKAWLEHGEQIAGSDVWLHSADLSGVTEVDAAGLQLLVAVNKRLAETNGEFRLVNPSERVEEVLAQTRLAELFAGVDNRG